MTSIQRLGAMLAGAFEAAVDSGDLARMDAAHWVAEREGFTFLSFLGVLRKGVFYQTPYAVTFVTEVLGSMEVNRAVKLATGRNRDEWYVVLRALEKGTQNGN